MYTEYILVYTQTNVGSDAGVLGRSIHRTWKHQKENIISYLKDKQNLKY